MRFLHAMIRVLDLDAALDFFALLGLRETRRSESEAGRFTLVFLSTGHPDDPAEVELTDNWDQDEPYTGGRNFGHLAYAGDDIYASIFNADGSAQCLGAHVGYGARARGADGAGDAWCDHR